MFWGTSYATAAFSGLFRTPERISLLLLSAICCLGALWLARDLWGGWVAAFFMALNFDWIQRSFLGGSEPLFVLVILASLLFARKESWKTASLLASLATVVRPIGIPLLLALGVVQLARQQ